MIAACINYIELEHLRDWATALEQYKLATGEWKSNEDNSNIKHRFLVGILGEYGVAKAMQYPGKIDLTIGSCKSHMGPDLPEWNCGVKAKTPDKTTWLVGKVDCDQIFCTVDIGTDSAVVIVEGWAPKEMINANIDLSEMSDYFKQKGKGKYVGELLPIERKAA